MAIDVIGLDADDTLWHSEDGFSTLTGRFAELVGPFAVPGEDGALPDLAESLDGVERRNLGLFGYGVKSFTLSMVVFAFGRLTFAGRFELVARFAFVFVFVLALPFRLSLAFLGFGFFGFSFALALLEALVFRFSLGSSAGVTVSGDSPGLAGRLMSIATVCPVFTTSPARGN